MLEVEEETGNTSPPDHPPNTQKNIFQFYKLKIVKIREQTCTVVMSSQGTSPGLLNKYALHAALCISKGMHMRSSCKLLLSSSCASSESEGEMKSPPSVLQKSVL